MGKAAKAHRAKVEKKNRRIAQERYAMQNKLNKMMQSMAEGKNSENLDIKFGEQDLNFNVISDDDKQSIVSFKENHPEIVEPEFDSAGFSIADREPDSNQE